METRTEKYRRIRESIKKFEVVEKDVKVFVPYYDPKKSVRGQKENGKYNK